MPAVNQIEIHPYFQHQELRRFGLEHGILPEAYSPLAQGEVLRDPVISGLAERYGKTPAQVVLRWHIQSGNIVIPKSNTPARIKENFEIFDFELSTAEMKAIDGLDRGARTGADPATFVG
jgi:2,5-diketo-D-gluconate reductase A